MLDTFRLLIALALLIAPLRADADPTCDLASQMMEIDMLIGLEGRHQAALQQSIGELAENPTLRPGSVSARLNGLTLPSHERANLVATIEIWREWQEVARRGANAGPRPVTRLTPALRHRMQHILKLCSETPGHGRDGGDTVLLASSQSSPEIEAQDPAGAAGGDLVLGGYSLSLLAILFGTCVASIYLICRLDDRRDKRHQLVKAGRVVLGDDIVTEARFRDLSRTGCCLELTSSANPEVGTRCSVVLGRCQIEGAVVWSDLRRIGVAFRRRLSRQDVAAILEGRAPARSGTVSSPFV